MLLGAVCVCVLFLTVWQGRRVSVNLLNAADFARKKGRHFPTCHPKTSSKNTGKESCTTGAVYFLSLDCSRVSKTKPRDGNRGTAGPGARSCLSAVGFGVRKWCKKEKKTAKTSNQPTHKGITRYLSCTCSN